MKLRDKRVAIVGTGCSAVQSIPHLAEWAKELYVFQRTPSMVNYRGNVKTDRNGPKRSSRVGRKADEQLRGLSFQSDGN